MHRRTRFEDHLRSWRVATNSTFVDFDDERSAFRSMKRRRIEDRRTICFAFNAGADVHVRSRTDRAITARRSRRTSEPFARTSPFLTHPVFNTLSQRNRDAALHLKLQSRDLSLAQSMIPLGSCTMKLNATSEMMPVTWPEFGRMHPFAPADQTEGYQLLFKQLEKWLAEITGFRRFRSSRTPARRANTPGLLAIRGYHESRGDATSQRLPDSDQRARHQPRQRRHRRLQGRRRRVRRARQHRRRRPQAQSRRAQRAILAR